MTKLELASSTRTVNPDFVDNEIREDLERMAKHKAKWRRRWIVSVCCCFIISIALLIAVIVYLAVGPWTLITFEAEWAARMHFGCAFSTQKKRLFIAGGTDRVKNFGDVWESTDRGKTWRRVVDLAAFGRRHGLALLQNEGSGRLYVIAGDRANPSSEGGTEPMQDVWRSDGGREWILQTAAAPWAPRKFLGACLDGQGSLYIVGGMSGYLGLNDMWKSSDEGVTWEPVSRASPWSARYSFSLVRTERHMYIVAGQDGRVQHDVWKSDDVGRTWQLMAFTHVREMTFTTHEERASWTPRFGAAGVANKHGLLTLTGGAGVGGDSDVNKEVWTLPPPESAQDSNPLKWKQESAPPWEERWGHQSYVDEDGVVYVLGGGSASGCYRDVWKMAMSIDANNLRILLDPSSVASTKGGTGDKTVEGEVVVEEEGEGAVVDPNA